LQILRCRFSLIMGKEFYFIASCLLAVTPFLVPRHFYSQIYDRTRLNKCNNNNCFDYLLNSTKRYFGAFSNIFLKAGVACCRLQSKIRYTHFLLSNLHSSGNNWNSKKKQIGILFIETSLNI